jgi:beta-barrel assembly-enhancing protease
MMGHIIIILMKKFLIVLGLFMSMLTIKGQTQLNLGVDVKSGTYKGTYKLDFSKGEALITDVYYAVDLPNRKGVNSYVIKGKQNGKDIEIVCRDLSGRFNMEPTGSSLQDYWDVRNLMSLTSLSKLSDLYSIRTNMEEDAMSYISSLRQYGLLFNDPYLESYLYSVISKIAPHHRVDGFPFNLSLAIVRDDSMNACVFPNGTILINTGLLANIHTEDELVAVLAHEIGHFASNHSLVNLQKAIQRKQRAETFSAIATAIAATTEIAASSNGYYADGSLTFGTAILSSAIAADVAENLGQKFNREQEEEADEMAVHTLGLLGYDKNACATLFARMTDVYNKEGNWAAYYMTEDHPSLKDRIQKCGTPNLIRDRNFEKNVSFAVTNAAITKFNIGRFEQALNFVNQNIEIGVANDDDYLLKARCLLNLNDSQASNVEALSLIRKAKEINPNNVNIVKTEIIATIRNSKYSDAQTLLTNYMNDLKVTLDSIDADSQMIEYLNEEMNWARKMIIKVRALNEVH